MIVRLRVSKVEQVVCNNYTLQVEPEALAQMLSDIPTNDLRQILRKVKPIGF